MTALPATPLVPSALRKKLLTVALASPEFRSALKAGAAEIRASATPKTSEATIEGVFERVLYAVLRDIGWKLHPTKEVQVDLRRHVAKGRIDSRFGAVIVEYKRPAALRTALQIRNALEQLEQYLTTTSLSSSGVVVGLLTNGLTLFELRAITGQVTARSAAVPIGADSLERIARLLAALELTALTAENLIRDFCASATDGILFRVARSLDAILAENTQPKTDMLYSEWREMFRLSHEDLSQQRRIEDRRAALGSLFEIPVTDAALEYRTLFALQTAYALLLKLLAYRVVSDVYLGRVEPEFKALAKTGVRALRAFCADLEDGYTFRQLGILNLLEGDFFSWYCARQQWSRPLADAVREMLIILARYEDAPSIFSSASVHDLFRDLYEAAIPRAIRSSFGEFYTPYWLAQHVLRSALQEKTPWRALDPCCGSGTFLVAAIERLRSELQGAEPEVVLGEILDRVAGIDLNPVSVLTARVHYFIHISDLLASCDLPALVIPIYLGDAASVPERISVGEVPCLHHQLTTLRSPIDTVFPEALVSDTARFINTMFEYERLIRGMDGDAALQLLAEDIPYQQKTTQVMEELARVTTQLVELERTGWNGIWGRILANFLTTSCLGKFDAIVGNPPWIDWKNLPAGYREKIKGMCIDRGLFSGARRTGGINLNICALLSYTSLTNWMREGGRLAFLMPRELISQASYEGWRRLGDKGWEFLEFVDWTKAGHPFDPIKEDFLTFIIGSSAATSELVPVVAMTKRKGDKLRAADWRNAEEALEHLDATPRVAGQIIPESTAFTVADKESELAQFAMIAGESEYIGREGIEFYPQETLLFRFDSMGPRRGTVWLRNVQNTRSKYKRPQQRVLLETKHLYPLVKGPEIAPYAHNYSGLIVAFPYHADEPLRPLPATALRFESPLLYDYYQKSREVLEGQTQYSDRIRGPEPGEFYGLARTGPYSFANVYVAFRDNTRWCAAVIKDAEMPWGERRRLLFQNHAVSICERGGDGDFIDEDEAYFVCGILNAPIVGKFILASSDERSFKIRPPVFVPAYDARMTSHRQIAAFSRKAHADHRFRQAAGEEIERAYLGLCRARTTGVQMQKREEGKGRKGPS